MKKFIFIFSILHIKLSAPFSRSFTFVAGKIIDGNSKNPVAGVYVGIPAKGASTIYMNRF